MHVYGGGDMHVSGGGRGCMRTGGEGVCMCTGGEGDACAPGGGMHVYGGGGRFMCTWVGAYLVHIMWSTDTAPTANVYVFQQLPHIT